MRRKNILCFLLLLFILNSNAEQPLLVKLKGTEILCEYITNSNSGFSPGIYAIDIKNLEPICVIPNGKKPLWSPDHKKFLYWYEGCVWIADIEKKIAYNSNYRGLGIHVNSNVKWNVVGDSIIEYGTAYKDYSITLFTGLKDKFNKVMWENKNKDNVGKYSQSSDGKYVVYENITFIPKMLSIPESLKIVDIQTNNIIEIPAVDNDSYQYNPMWQPNGNQIAFEVYNRKTKKISIYLYDIKTNKSEKLDLKNRVNYLGIKCQSEGDNDSTQLLMWSPTGDSLLVSESGSQYDVLSIYNTHTYVIPLDKTKIVYSFDFSSGYIYENACWSSDSQMVAFIKGKSLDPISSKFADFVIWKFNEKNPCVPVTILEGLTPVNISW